jgi:hypothetical protein
MRYLPTSHLEGFWEILPRLVQDALRPRNVLESRTGKRLYTINQVRELPQEFLVDDEPLVPDLPQCDVYLSEKYATRDLAILRRSGLRELSHAEMIARIRQDIGDFRGRLRSKPLDDLWHNHFVNFVDYLLRAPGNLDDVHALDFIPLSTGKWVSLNYVARNSVYTPYAINADDGQIKVPITPSLNIDTVHDIAYCDGERASFFTSHGISDCPPYILVRKIKEAERFNRSSSMIGFVSYLAIMFWYGQSDISLLPVTSGQIRAVDETNTPRHTSSLFLPSQRAYDAADLLSQTTLNRNFSHGMLSRWYLDSPVKSALRNGKTWEQWLEKIAGISYFPSLTTTSNGRTTLNPVLQTVAKDNPSKFMPNLRAHWQAKYIFEPWRHASKEISATLVPCSDGVSRPLSGTILPFEKAVAEATSFGLGQRMPFLELLPGSLTEGIEPWRFLAPFGVLCDLNLDFYTLMLQQIRGDSGSVDLRPACIRLYEKIAKQASLEDSNKLQVRPWLCGMAIPAVLTMSRHCFARKVSCSTPEASIGSSLTGLAGRARQYWTAMCPCRATMNLIASFSTFSSIFLELRTQRCTIWWTT